MNYYSVPNKCYHFNADAIETPEDLRDWHHLLNPDSQFFHYANMRMFGDYFSNYGIRTTPDWIELYRKAPTRTGLDGSAYFHPYTLEQIWPSNV